ncbi:MAG: helix-turn-helix transcriptional regulator [Bacilli bacterium]|nr:helix-turn-helix transcriptional regulator [Bacilli bacterium]
MPNIKYLRLEHHLTQGELAKLIGVSPQTLSNWERGYTEPDIKSLQKLATNLGTTIDYLIGLKETDQMSLLLIA